MKRYVCCLFFVLQMLPGMVWGQEVVEVRDKNEIFLVGKQCYFLEDVEGKLSIEDILSADIQSKFKRIENDVFARPATRSAYWFRLTVSNHTTEELWLEVGTSFAWYLDFYAPDQYHLLETGAMRPRERKYHDINWFWLPLNPPNDPRPMTYYFRIIELEPSFEVPLRVGTLSKLSKDKDSRDFLSAGFIGAMLIMFLYNLFIYFATKYRVYVYYLGYLFSATFVITYLNYYFILDDFSWVSVPWFMVHFPLWSAPVYVFTALFCIHYLHLGMRSYRVSFLLIVSATAVLAVLVPLLTETGIADMVSLGTLYNTSVLVLYLTCLVTAYLQALMGEQRAILYSIGWTFMVISVCVYVMTINGIIAYSLFTHNIMYFGVTAEAWVFSLALGNRINYLRKQNLVLIKEQNKILEQKVAERTKEIETTNEELRVVNDTLSQTNHYLKTTTDQLQTSIRAAKGIQQALLPHAQKVQELLPHHFLIYRPKDVVSGDFYWLTRDTNDQSTILVIADCTGHGVPGAFMTLIGHNLLDKIVRVWRRTDPAEILEALHQEIHLYLQQKDTQDNSGMDMGIICLKENTLIFAGAKRPLYYQIPQEKTLQEIKGTAKSIGGRQKKQRTFVNHHLTLPIGTMLYLGSDGLTDQNNAQREKLGTVRFKAHLSEIAHLPLEEQRQYLEDVLDDFQGQEEQRDDILWMGIRLC